MSKKEANSFIFEGEKIKFNFFDEDNEEDKTELKNLHNILTNSSRKSENDDDNKDLNNITSVSETDEVYLGEVKDATKKSQESEYEIEDELNETSLTNKNSDEEEEKNSKDLDDMLGNNNILNKNNNINNIDNINKNEIELNSLNKINKNNTNNQNQLFNDINNEGLLSNQKEEKPNKIKKEKHRNKSKNKKKSPIFLIKKIKKRSKKIQLLRKKKGLHIVRKKDSDTIRRKIKTYFHNYLLDLLNSTIKKLNIKKEIYNLNGFFLGQKSHKKKVNKFLKFNNKFTTDVTINLNKNLLLKKISHILTIEPISSKYKAYDLKNNCYLTKYILGLKSFSDIHKLLNFTYMETYNNFLNSENYKNILKKIEIRDGEAYMTKFRNVSINYISYFKNAKPKKEPKCEIKKKVFFKDKHIKLDINQGNQGRDKEKKNILNFSINNNINNSSFINESYKFKNIKEMLDIPFVNNNMSLLEEFHDSFRKYSNHSNRDEKSLGSDYNNININNNENWFIQNYQENSFFIENENNSLEKGNKLLLKDNFNNFWFNHNMEFSLEKNNLSEIIDNEFLSKNNNFLEEDDSMAICKKSTNDY